MKVLIAVVTVLLVCGCSSSKSLTRDKAKQLIESDAGFQGLSVPIRLTDQGLQLGIQEGYLTKNPYVDVYDPTAKGLTVFQAAAGSLGGTPPQWQVLFVSVPKKRITKINDIEGGDAETTRVVGFEWVADVSSLPTDLQKAFENQPAQIMRRTLILYDDGWRVGPY
jgi:hypothetical protein